MANQRILRALNCMTLFLVLCLCPLCFGQSGQSVVVQVLNARDGKPIPDQLVILQLRNADAKPVMLLNSKTDLDGEAHFVFLEVRPETMAIDVTVTQTGLHCTRHIVANSETLAHEGILVAGRTRSSRLSVPIQPAPGHIVFVARPSTLLEKVLFD